MTQKPIRIGNPNVQQPWQTYTPPRVVNEQPARVLAGGKFVTTDTLTSRTCKWPIGDPSESDFHYCGHPPELGRPYCDAHDRRSYQSTARRKAV